MLRSCIRSCQEAASTSPNTRTPGGGFGLTKRHALHVHLTLGLQVQFYEEAFVEPGFITVNRLVHDQCALPINDVPVAVSFPPSKGMWVLHNDGGSPQIHEETA